MFFPHFCTCLVFLDFGAGRGISFVNFDVECLLKPSDSILL